MADTPVIVRSRRDAAPQDFNFQPAQVRVEGLSPALRAYRQQAWEAFQSLPIPTPAEEAWRRTDLRALRPASLRLPQPGEFNALPPIAAELMQPLTGDAHGGQLLLLPGGVQAQVDAQLQKMGVIFTDLLTAEREHPALLAKVLGQIVHAKEGKFAALAGALAQNGVFVYVPRGAQVEQPLHSLVWGPGNGLAHLTQVVVYLEAGASATFVHESASPEEAQSHSLHAGTVELYVGEGANLRFVELQSWGQHVWNFSHERARVERDANLDWIFGAVGSRLTKNFTELDLVGSGSLGKMSGFYITNHNQHLDHDTQQNHMAPNTTSDLLFKGALLDESRSVWQGMIYVAPGAAKTDGYQANRNLVLSPQARADSIPGLEILADDVRCTHGATVGRIDQEQVFYLLSRGIPRAEAERLVVEGFFDPIMQRIPFEGVRARFQQAIHNKLDGS